MQMHEKMGATIKTMIAPISYLSSKKILLIYNHDFMFLVQQPRQL